MSEPNDLIPLERIAHCIYFIRGEKVMFDSDLAELYQVETKTLNRAVKRNPRRFPEDFVFQLSKEEFETLRFQFGTSSWGGRRYAPYAFTEQGVAMLSSLLRSDRASDVNVAIMRTFVRMRKLLSINEELAQKVKEHDQQISVLYDHLRRLLEVPSAPKRNSIGYKKEQEEE